MNNCARCNFHPVPENFNCPNCGQKRVRTDILTDHGIIVLSEAERSLMLDMLGESVDARVESNSDETLESLNLYNKMGIGKSADSTVEHNFGVNKQKKESKSHGTKHSKKPRRKRNAD
jgi:RNA polymerase subunit RPABC4/transcription elongation factor Spt4